LQPLPPERMASPDLGMGKMCYLWEKQQEWELGGCGEDAQKLQEAPSMSPRLFKQIAVLSRMGSLGGLLKMIPA